MSFYKKIDQLECYKKNCRKPVEYFHESNWSPDGPTFMCSDHAKANELIFNTEDR
jgi:hypothetical protein